MSNLLRRIVLKHTRSTATLSLTRDISSTTFTNSDVYKNSPAVKQEAFNTVAQYAAICGIDAGGADTVELPGAFHSGGPLNGDRYERLTGLVRDKAGKPMYFYRTSDGTFWDRIHIPRITTANQGLWANQPDYQAITKAQFDNKKL